MSKSFDLESYLAEFGATEADIEKGIAKRCTKHDCPCGNVPLSYDAFYNDKSQKTGKASWCKAGEAVYNQSYNKALKETAMIRKRDIIDAEAAEKFESIMASQRRPRALVGVQANTEAPTEKVEAVKSAPVKSAPRKRTSTKKTAPEKKTA
jgi:formylmethanofuran dehydrogenase subunit B